MKKFECKHCELQCVLTPKATCFHPKFCPFAGGFESVWHEVKEETTTESNQLPDWCKVGEWVYDKAINRYSQVAEEDVTKGLREICNYISKGEIVPAHKRQFNKKEMLDLVGKVLSDHSGEWRSLILWASAKEVTTHHSSYSANTLMVDGYTIDDKPCFKLEHLDDKEEWVEVDTDANKRAINPDSEKEE